jgi:hypothetical protein
VISESRLSVLSYSPRGVLRHCLSSSAVRSAASSLRTSHDMMKLGLRAIGTGSLASLVTLALTSECVAAPPENVTPDPELQKWFEAPPRPRACHLRCSVIDCGIVVCAIRHGHCEVQINGRRYVVPNAVIIQGLANSADKAVACYDIGEFGPPLAPGHPRDQQQDTIEKLCFVPPRLPS